MLWSYPVLSGFMLSIQECRKIDPGLIALTDQELLEVRDVLYGLGKLAYEQWVVQIDGSKIPVGDCKIIN